MTAEHFELQTGPSSIHGIGRFTESENDKRALIGRFAGNLTQRDDKISVSPRTQLYSLLRL